MGLDNLNILLKIKFKLLSKNFAAIVGSLLAIFFAILFRYTLSNDMFNGQKASFILLMTVMFNAVMSSVMMISIPMAEEKEKNSLKLLVSSSVGQNEYLLATIIPPFIIIMITNIFLPFLSGANLNFSNYLMYLLVTIALTVISMLVGLVLGILSRKISDTSFLTTPIILPLILVPQFSSISSTFKNISDYLYTGILYNMLEKLVINQNITIEFKSIVVLIVESLMIWVLFIYLYKTKGLKK